MSDRPVALITGGAKRVGKAIALRLVEAGYDIAITYNSSAQDASSLLDIAREQGATAHSIQIDFGKPESVNMLVHWISDKFPRLDAIVNCASVYVKDDQPMGASVHLSQLLMQVNYYSPAKLVDGLYPMLKLTKGSVVNFVDILAERPMTSYSAYCASKAALWNATIAQAKQYAPEITINGIAPGVIDWPIDMPEEQKEAYLARVPLKRAGNPQDAAELVHFLIKSGKYITGQIIRLDGGRSIF